MLFYFFFHRLPCRPVVLHFYSTRVALSISLNPSVKVPFDRGFVGNDYAVLLYGCVCHKLKQYKDRIMNWAGP